MTFKQFCAPDTVTKVLVESRYTSFLGTILNGAPITLGCGKCTTWPDTQTNTPLPIILIISTPSLPQA